MAACTLCIAPAAVRGGDAGAAVAATSTTAVPPGGPLPYWQAPALPTAVIQGGTIPPGWQPRAVPYQGIGPDGRPLTVYLAPTYVFTYQSGPPVLAVPPAGRSVPGVASGPAPYGAYGWNYQSQGAPATPITLPPAPIPSAPPPAAVPRPSGFAPLPASPPPIAAPPAQWAPAGPTP
ncbi:MAG: hypothetical protein ACKOZU_07000 [Planctomycetaceae bacterium]